MAAGRKVKFVVGFVDDIILCFRKSGWIIRTIVCSGKPILTGGIIERYSWLLIFDEDTEIAESSQSRQSDSMSTPYARRLSSPKSGVTL